MRQLCLGTLMYADDNDQKLPLDLTSAAASEQALEKYVANPKLYASANPAGGSILGNSALGGKRISEVDSPETTILFYDSNPWRNGRQLVGFLNGQGTFETYSEFQFQLATPPATRKPSPSNRPAAKH